MAAQHDNFRVGLECTRRDYVRAPTNERYISFYHELYTAGDRDQFTLALKNRSLVNSVQTPSANIFATRKIVRPWEKYKDLTSRAVSDTFEYMFTKFKKGIFVQIHDNSFDTFIPFSNVTFKNDWSHLIQVDPRYGSMYDFLSYTSKLSKYSPSEVLPVHKWTANNALVRYEKTSREYTNNLAVLYDMYHTLCRERQVPDVEFFINRKDFPLLTRDGTEPYNHLYGSKDVPMDIVYNKYLPIFSSASSDRYADILVPTYEDWLRVLYQHKNQSIRYSCNKYPRIKQIPWDSKKKQAIFRGSSTGAGFDAHTNKRLMALEISQTTNLLDIGITKWNTRPRKYETERYLKTIERSAYPQVKTMTPQEQSTYAYVVHIEGHSAAFRLSYELSYGSVLLLVDSEWKVWFSKLLQPFQHYVPVKADLSDLVSQVQWCIDNDEQCKEIAANALAFYDKYLCYDGVMDYLQKTLIDVSDMVGRYSYVTDILSAQLQHEKENVNAVLHSMRWVKLHATPTHPIPYMGKWRNPNILKALQLSLHGYSGEPLLSKSLFKSKKTSVNLVELGIVKAVEKKSVNPDSRKENIHENFIGLNALNKLDIVNFAYIYGPRASNACDVVYSEYVDGISMDKWLVSRWFTVDKLLHILVQLNIALQVAQDRVGFIHYDLYPWNIMICQLEKLQEFSYYIRNNETLTIETNVVPVIIDFGKSRAVVYDTSSKCIRDHGFVNLYKSCRLIDTLTILISSIVATKNRYLFDKYSAFLRLAGFTDHMLNNLEVYKKYGQLFDLPCSNLDPISFVNFTVKEVKRCSDLKKRKYTMDTQDGNPYTLYFHSVYGTVHRALFETMQRILSNSLPNPKSAVEKSYTRAIVDNKSNWIRKAVDKQKLPDLSRKWLSVHKMLTSGRDNGWLVADTDFTLPRPATVSTMDKAMTPEEIRTRVKNLVQIRGDFPTILAMYTDLVYFDIEKEKVMNELKSINSRFDYLSDIAKTNTLIWINDLL